MTFHYEGVRFINHLYISFAYDLLSVELEMTKVLYQSYSTT